MNSDNTQDAGFPNLPEPVNAVNPGSLPDALRLTTSGEIIDPPWMGTADFHSNGLDKLSGFVDAVLATVSEVFGSARQDSDGEAFGGGFQPAVAPGVFRTDALAKEYSPEEKRALSEKLVICLQKDLALARPQALGIVEAIDRTSGLNAALGLGNTDSAFGWMQWRGVRRHAFKSFAREHGLPVASEAANYAFLVYELQGAYAPVLAVLRRLRSADNVAAVMFEIYVERPSQRPARS
jgi:hypothetical protein